MGFYYFRKKAGSRTALSHHFKFLMFLLAFDLVLGPIGCFFPVKPNLDTSSPLPTSTSGLQSTGRDEICQKLVHKFPCSEMHCCTSSLNSTPSPEKWQTRKKKSFVLALSDLSSAVKKIIPIKIFYRKTITPSKKGSFNTFLMCWIFTNSLFDCILTPILC